jgi:putative addiction module antidote
MSKRKFDAKLRKVGNSYVITIPKDTIDRFNLNEGDFLAIDLDTDEIKKLKNQNGNTNKKKNNTR